jgi:Protein of unknown function (DUF2442)
MTFLPFVIDAEYRGGYRIHVRFSDNVEKTIDFQQWLDGPVFEPLKDPEYFNMISGFSMRSPCSDRGRSSHLLGLGTAKYCAPPLPPGMHSSCSSPPACRWVQAPGVSVLGEPY